MRALTISESGSLADPNEDWVAATSDLVVVLDGATARTASGCAHGVPWFTGKLGMAIVNEASDRSQSLTDALSAAISHVASLHPDCDLDHPGTPSAAVGIVRLNDDRVETLVLADITIAVRDGSGAIQVFVDARPDESVRDEMDQAISLPADDPRRAPALQAMKLAQHARRNRSGGYFIAASDPSAAKEAYTATLAVRDVQALAVLTDGAARAVELYKVLTWSDLFTVLDNLGPAELLRSVRDLESSDPRGERWPRTKTSDDATVAYLHL